MSSESFAALRKHAGEDLARLAEEHYKHDLQESDRQKLQDAAKKFSTFAMVGSAIGLGLGVALAFRVRANRMRIFQSVRAAEKPTHVQFADGRTEPLPDMTQILRPTVLGDVATYTLFTAGGIFLFGELGALAGSYSASRSISSDAASKARIESAFRRFRADVFRKQAEDMEKGVSGLSL